MDRARLVASLAQPALPSRDFIPTSPHLYQSVRSVRRNRGALEVTLVDERGRRDSMEVRPVASDIVRVHIGPDAGRPSRLLVPEAPAAAEWELEEDRAGWTLVTSNLRLRVERSPYRLRLFDSGGRRERFAERSDDKDIGGRYYHYPSGRSRELRWLTAALRPEESLFGMGEHFGPINRRGQAFALWAVDAFGVRSDRAYKSVPLLLSTSGYAVFFDMTAPIYMDMGRASTAAWQATARANHFRAYLILADDPASQLRAYHRLTGSPAVPPRWSFGFWMSRWGYRNREEVMTVARRLRTEGVPCDVIHIDPYWLRYHEGHHGDLTWDESAFPRPAEMIEELRSMGFRVSLWESPYVPEGSQMFEEGLENDFLLKASDGKPALVTCFKKPSGAVDFTKPKADAWFREKNRKVLQMGAAVMKTDFAEDMPDGSRPYDGTSWQELHNLYPLLYQRAVFETTREVHGYGLIWGRSGYAGAQRFPVHWGGDSGCSFSDMAASLRGALSWVLSGPAFASFDIGGFYGFPNVDDPPSRELYIRWAQMGLLFSHSRAHGHTSAREPWAFGEQALQIFRDYALLRYRLLPYLFSAAQSATGGTPLARPLVYDYPNDRTTHHLDDQYLLGPDLLVAPMFEPEGERDVYLPGGTWFDYWTDWLFHSGWHRRHVPLQVLPVYVRAGALIPLGAAITSTMDDASEPLTLEAYPHSPGTTEIDVHDEAGKTSFRLIVDEVSARVEGPANSQARVRIHRGSAQPVETKLGDFVPLSPS